MATVVSRTAASEALRAAVQQSHTLAVLVQVLDGGTGDVLHEIDSVVSGTVTLDAKAAVRGRCELEIADPNLIPKTANDLLAPYGNELRVCRGVRHPNGTEEVVSLGIFRIRRVEPVEEPTLSVRVTGLDRWSRIADARFEEPLTIPAGTNYISAMTHLAQGAWPTVPINFDSTSLTTGTLAAEAGEDRSEMLRSMGTDFGREVFFDGDGVLTMRPVPQGPGSQDWSLVEGDGGLLVSAAREWDSERVYNRVIASGEPIDDQPPVRGVATDDNPQSPTYYFGPFGKRPRFYVSQMITTEEQAADAAAGILATALGTSQRVSFGAVCNPLMEPGQTALIRRERLGIDEVHIIDSLTVPLTASEPMTGATRVVEVLGQ